MAEVRRSRFRILVFIFTLLVPPIPFLWFGWSFIGSPQGFAAIVAIMLSYSAWIGFVAARVTIVAPQRDWLLPPKPQPLAPQPLPPPVSSQLSAQPLSALHSLPPAPAAFTSRTHEVNQLLADLKGGARVAISGLATLADMGGVGKTALALFVANQIKSQYPDAQIFLELKGTSKTPQSPTEAMLQFIHAFGPTADLRQASKEEIAALYRSLLDEKRALLLFDIAAGDAQVAPLLPCAGWYTCTG